MQSGSKRTYNARGCFPGNGSGYRLLVIFYATTILLVCLLGWMGWQLVQQDRQLARQRLEERRDHAADLAVNSLKESLLQIGSQLAQLSAADAATAGTQAEEFGAALGADSAVLIFSPGDAAAFPPGRLLFSPGDAAVPTIPSALFAGADALEFSGGRLRGCHREFETAHPAH